MWCKIQNEKLWNLGSAVQGDTSIRLSLCETITQVGLKQKNRAFVGQMGM